MINFVKYTHLFLENMAEEDNQSLYNENNENNRVRTLRDCMNLTRTIARSCIFFPPDASHFNFKPGIIQLLPSFHGLDLENPYLLSHVCGGAAIVHPQGKIGNILFLANRERDKEFLSLYVKIWTGSRHLVFWLLGTLTGLRDWVRRLVA